MALVVPYLFSKTEFDESESEAATEGQVTHEVDESVKGEDFVEDVN